MPTTPSSRRIRAAALAVAALLVACGNGTDPTAAPQTETSAPASSPTPSADPPTPDQTSDTTTDTPTDGTREVTMQSLQFMPQEITVAAGTTVTWDNQDSVAHTVTARSDNAAFDSGNLDAGASFQMTFDEPGTYEYVCDYHVGSGMTGTIIVE